MQYSRVHQRSTQYVTENNLKLILDFVVVKWIGSFIVGLLFL